LGKALDRDNQDFGKRNAVLAACGLDVCDNGREVTLDIVDRQQALAWFERALADFDADQQ
jgi:hypothetical protein